MYDGVTIDGVNDAGLGQCLYLSSATYPKRDPASPAECGGVDPVPLDMFGSVASVEGLTNPPFALVSPVLPGGHAATATWPLRCHRRLGHLRVSGRRVGRDHGAGFTVMTNDPTTINSSPSALLDEVAATPCCRHRAPPTGSCAPRYYLNGSASTGDSAQGIAEVFAIGANVSVPMIQSTPDEPNVAPTLWRTASTTGR